MAKKSKSPQKNLASVLLTPRTVGEKAKSAAKALAEPQGAITAQNAAAMTKAGVANVVADGEAEATLTRREAIDALPTLQEVTGLEPATDCVTFIVTPLREGKAAAACFHELSKPADIAAATREMRKVLDEAIVARGDGLTLEQVSEGGRMDVYPLRNNAQRNRCQGNYHVRIQECYGEYVENTLSGRFPETVQGAMAVVSPSLDVVLEQEIFVDEGGGAKPLYPGSVIEQIYVQAGVSAVAIWDFDRQMTAYRFKYTSHAQEAAVVKRGYLVRLGKGAELGTLMPQPIQQRVQWETIILHGATGMGSARDFVLPGVTRALAVSRDLARIREAQGVKRGRGFFAEISFPYSKAKYLQVMKLLETKHFKLPIGDGVLEITLAATMVEMGKILNMDLVKEEVVAEEEEEVDAPRELRFEEGTHRRLEGELIDAALWDRHREIGARAACEGRRRLRAAAMRGYDEGREPGVMHSCACLIAEGEYDFSLAQLRHKALEARSGAWTTASALATIWAEGAQFTSDRGARAGRAEWGGQLTLQACTCWQQRPLNHLLGWGYDARGCGGGRCK